MEIPFNIKAAIEFQEEKHKKRREKLEKLHQEAVSDFNSICRMIIGKYNPERIYQWGSVLEKHKFWELSDIDIAIEGKMSPEVFFDLLHEADSLTKFPLDIVELENIHPLHKKMIVEKGKLIYEREKH